MAFWRVMGTVMGVWEVRVGGWGDGDLVDVRSSCSHPIRRDFREMRNWTD